MNNQWSRQSEINNPLTGWERIIVYSLDLQSDLCVFVCISSVGMCLVGQWRHMLVKRKTPREKSILSFVPIPFCLPALMYHSVNVPRSMNSALWLVQNHDWHCYGAKQTIQPEISTITESLYFFVISVFSECRRKTARQMRLISATATMRRFVRQLASNVPACALVLMCPMFWCRVQSSPVVFGPLWLVITIW